MLHCEPGACFSDTNTRKVYELPPEKTLVLLSSVLETGWDTAPDLEIYRSPQAEGKVGSLCWEQRDTEMQQKGRAVCAPPLLFVLHTAPGTAPCWSAALAQANPSCVQETEA